MVRAYHVIFCTYGFWLPNDQRGSWSEFVGAWELLRFGRATKTDTRQSVAGKPFDRAKRDEARRTLKYPVVEFTGLQARAVGEGFAIAIEKAGLEVWACTVLPQHVHLVVARHRLTIEQVVNQLKGAATRRLNELGVHPLAAHATKTGRPPRAWARGQWKVFLNQDADIERAVRYVEQNPIKEDKPRQRWGFVTRFDGEKRSPTGRG